MFKSEGTFDVIIKDAIPAEPKFSKMAGAFDVCLKVSTEDGQIDWWRGEVSGEYGKGNFANKTQAQITMETLTKLGLPNNDLTQLKSLVGKSCSVTTKASVRGDKTYYNVRYINTDFAPDALAADELQRRIAMFAGGGAQQAPQQQQQPTTQPFPGQQANQQQGTAANPFLQAGSF